MTWEAPSDRPLSIDAFAQGDNGDYVAYALRTSPLLETDAPSVSLTLAPYQDCIVSGTVTFASGADVNDLSMEFTKVQGKAGTRYGSPINITSTGPDTATYAITVAPGFDWAGACVDTASLATSNYGW